MGQLMFVGLAMVVCTASGGAQDWQAEGHATFSRTTQSHTQSWGAGAQVAGTWGGKSAPVQLGMSVGGDWMA